MESAMARFCQQPLSKLETVEREGNYWSAIEPQNRFGGNSSHEVWEQEEMPYLDIPHLTIYDNRKRDFQFWMSSVTGRNYKPLPAQLVLGSLH